MTVMGLTRPRPSTNISVMRIRLIALCLTAVMLDGSRAAFAQSSDQPTCRPRGSRAGEIGCWIIVDDALGTLPSEPVFWHLDTYPSRATAQAAQVRGGTVVESLGTFWLFTIAGREWRPNSGEHVADVGPLPVREGVAYSAMYMEAIFTPGMTSSTHTHGGPEAWYTLAGETCLETPDGIIVGRAGGPPVIVPAGPPMHLTATGTIERRAIVLILHDSSQPATTVTHTWTPRGLCKTPQKP
jgi:quercetin dioxygenase-like cupin family protein